MTVPIPEGYCARGSEACADVDCARDMIDRLRLELVRLTKELSTFQKLGERLYIKREES